MRDGTGQTTSEDRATQLLIWETLSLAISQLNLFQTRKLIIFKGCRPWGGWQWQWPSWHWQRVRKKKVDKGRRRREDGRRGRDWGRLHQAPCAAQHTEEICRNTQDANAIEGEKIEYIFLQNYTRFIVKELWGSIVFLHEVLRTRVQVNQNQNKCKSSQSPNPHRGPNISDMTYFQRPQHWGWLTKHSFPGWKEL